MKKSSGGRRIIKRSKQYKGGRVAFPIEYYGGLSNNLCNKSSKVIVIKGGGKSKSKTKTKSKSKKIKKSKSKNKSKKRSKKMLTNNNKERKKVNYNMKKWFNLS